ncbi:MULTISPECIES: hypothetical protein [Actinosynnema]|uniref:hypothetical protein n=1 Tax=Actinosynnema TaxID=40566 RepID=UPI0020A2B24A|nr:hypothetical protein [Actinosynnema pretiosum]
MRRVRRSLHPDTRTVPPLLGPATASPARRITDPPRSHHDGTDGPPRAAVDPAGEHDLDPTRCLDPDSGGKRLAAQRAAMPMDAATRPPG